MPHENRSNSATSTPPMPLAAAGGDRVAEALLAERQQLAQQLHDSVCQNLSGMRILSELLARELKTSAPATAPKAVELVQLIQRTSEELQALIHSLRQDS